FRAQGKTLAVPIIEGVHLLLDDVRYLADGAAEQFGVFEERQADLEIAERFHHLAYDLFDVPPCPRRRRKHVVHAPDGVSFHDLPTLRGRRSLAGRYRRAARFAESRNPSR